MTEGFYGSLWVSCWETRRDTEETRRELEGGWLADCDAADTASRHSCRRNTRNSKAKVLLVINIKTGQKSKGFHSDCDWKWTGNHFSWYSYFFSSQPDIYVLQCFQVDSLLTLAGSLAMACWGSTRLNNKGSRGEEVCSSRLKWETGRWDAAEERRQIK